VTSTLTLPAGLTSRPLELADAEAVYMLMAAQEEVDLGKVAIELADISGDWQRPSFDVAAGTMGVFDGGVLVGYAELSGRDRADAAVHPAYRGRGIGTALAHWVSDLARSRGSDVVGMPVPKGSPGDRLLAALGWHVRWESWVLQLPEGMEIARQPLPDGYILCAGKTESDRRAAWTVLEDAFLEWSRRDRQSFEDFCAVTTDRPGFEPWNLQVVKDTQGIVVGACHVTLATGDADSLDAFVHRLAVRRDRRRLGLARAMLADAFASARAHGATVSELSTDSRTGALSLYERVGMVVTDTWVNRAVSL
jgi:mycothiol synthase